MKSAVLKWRPRGHFLISSGSNSWRLLLIGTDNRCVGTQLWGEVVSSPNGHQSSSAYESLRQSGCLLLPSQRTLRDYTHSDEDDQQFMEVGDISTLTEFQKRVLVILDEMYIKEGLVYNKHSCALLGFTDLGSSYQQSSHRVWTVTCFWVRHTPLKPYQKPCLFSWCGACSLISSSHMHSLHVHLSLVIRSSIPSGNVSCALRGVDSWL